MYSNDLIKFLHKVYKDYGNLAVVTLNQNNFGVNENDFAVSDNMELAVEDILCIDGRLYVKSRDYDEWYSDKVDGNDDYLIEIISKRNPELKNIALEMDYEDQEPIIYHYYMNDLNWIKVVLMTNYN